ncbi:MAG: porin [Cyclobacteriaceae bacterium]
MKKKLLLPLALVIMVIPMSIKAQGLSNYSFGKGLKVKAEDGSFEMKFSTRFQTLYLGELNLETNNYSDQMLIRRARLKFDGFAFSEKLVYKIELGISNRDTRNSSTGGLPQHSGTSNIILDAVIKYKFAKGWELWFGQTKLPGNRERVISSQKLQFVDRSLVNSRFNIDRDLGLQLRRSLKLGNVGLKLIGSIAVGEGRDITSRNPGGYDYTGRIELLPFGEFSNKGDYFASDLEREEKPKLSIGITGDYNDGAVRRGGQLGGFVVDTEGNQLQSDLSAIFVDAIFKYKGFSFASEFASKGGDNVQGFRTGSGFVAQAGYLFNSNFEPAFRYTVIEADNRFSALSNQTEYTLGFSRYFSGHNLKVQTDFSYSDFAEGDDEFRYRLQMEVSF